MRHLSWLVTLPVTILAVAFAVANREEVQLGLWPLSHTIPLPVYVIALGSLVAGFLLGGLIAWIAGGPRRRRARQTAERARELARDLAEQRRRQAAEAAPLARPDQQAGLPVDHRPVPHAVPHAASPGARGAALEHLPGA